ncbi:MAG: FAD-dependent oxidoreductase [Elainellaceae cyanobacterium]
MSDVLVLGGGIIGLAIAVELRQRGASVTVLTRNTKEAAARAAAGMLAPHAEDLPPGPLLDLCCYSLGLYPEWIRTLEALSGTSTGYWPCGILAPQYKPCSLPWGADKSPGAGQWLDNDAIRYAQPGLGEEVCGGRWFPEDGQVDNRLLLDALYNAASELGVDIHCGIAVESLQQKGDRIVGLRAKAVHHGTFPAGTDQSRLSSPQRADTGAETVSWSADHYVLAAGAWARQLIPVPVQPCKGEMLAVRLPQHAPRLHQVLFGPGVYIVPRRDGRIVVGATVEPDSFAPGNTAQGIHQLLEQAIRLYPALKTYPLDEIWWGFRPQTPDEMPILGPGHCCNLTLAVGHYRNGVLMAPATAQLLADQICPQTDVNDASSGVDIGKFSWTRFLSPVMSQPTPSDNAVTDDSVTSDSVTVAGSLTVDIHRPPLSSNLFNTATSTMPTQFASTSPTGAAAADTTASTPEKLTIAGRTFGSRLMTGTGKYRSFDHMRQAIAVSGCEIVTVAVRRVQTSAPGHEGLAEALDWDKLWMLPNTAGCKTAEDAVRVARLGREMAKLLGQEDNNFIKLEVIPDAKYLLPDPIGTLQAAEQLVKEGFAVLPYINADPLLARRLEEAGCVTVMPLGSPIGSGQGIKNAANIQIIVETATVPVVVDAGIGTPSEAAHAMELGADALLINTAIAQANNPVAMAMAMAMATEAGWLAAQAGRIPVKSYASASSPVTGTVTQP